MPPEIPSEWVNKPKTFTDEDVLTELNDALYWAPDRVNFRFKHWTDKVEVYIWWSLNYVINRHLYNKLMENGWDHSTEY